MSTRDFVVRTIPLHRLSSAEAVKLLTPYIQSPGGGVFEISSQIRAVTIREDWPARAHPHRSSATDDGEEVGRNCHPEEQSDEGSLSIQGG